MISNFKSDLDKISTEERMARESILAAENEK